MAGGVGHTGGLTNPRPWRGRCQAGFSNTSGPPLPRKRAPYNNNNKKSRKMWILELHVVHGYCNTTSLPVKFLANPEYVYYLTLSSSTLSLSYYMSLLEHYSEDGTKM